MAKGRRAADRARSVGDLRRREGTRQPRKSILIVCEGDATEPEYLGALIADLRLGSIVNVEIVPGARQHITLVRHAIELRERRLKVDQRARKRSELSPPPYDDVYCVFDVETDDGAVFDTAVRLAKEHKFKLAVSNVCFEYWLLLHFEHTTRSFYSAKEVAGALRKHLPDYDKHIDEKTFRTTLRPLIPEAVKRAKIILAAAQTDEFPNPSTSVCLLVDELIGMANFPL